MNGIDRGQLITVLTLLVMALFVSSGVRFAGRWHRPLRTGAIALFAVALALVLVEIAIWLSGGGF